MHNESSLAGMSSKTTGRMDKMERPFYLRPAIKKAVRMVCGTGYYL